MKTQSCLLLGLAASLWLAASPAGHAQPLPPPLPLPLDFLDTLVDPAAERVSFPLPGGALAEGSVQRIERDARGILRLQGRLEQPQQGFYFFQRQTVAGVAGAMVGVIHFDEGELAYRIEPAGQDQGPVLVPRDVDEVICRNLSQPPAPAEAEAGPEPEQAAPGHPDNIPIPEYQNGVIPLSSLPEAIGVIYLDFDGEPGPFAGWGEPLTAAPTGASNSQIREVWQRVAEDFAPFNLNVTTDRRVFDRAPEGRRQHVVITPSFQGAGVAYIGSYNWNGDTVCWSGYSTGKAAAEVISHEVGHTLHLGHDGRTDPQEEYYGGTGSGDTGWAPIMGVGYYQNLTQWSKGEYPNPTNTQDDLLVITTNNNDVDYRADLGGGDHLLTADYLEILPDNSVAGEGIIETSADADSFRFKTTGGLATLVVAPVQQGPNLDVLAEIVDSNGLTVISDNPVERAGATVSAALVPGEYRLRISGVGRSTPAAGGYSDYASLGAYLISGSVAGGEKPDRFTLAENSPAGTPVGTVQPRAEHGSAAVGYAISSGNENGAFAIDRETGAITVADAAQMNYEARSLRWDDPATFQLFVSVSETLNPAANESIRVVVTLTDLNEPPVVTPGAAITVYEHTRPGTLLRTVTFADPDRFDFPSSVRIASGDPEGAFAIDKDGRLTVANDFSAAERSVYDLEIEALDQGKPPTSGSSVVRVNVLAAPAGYQAGTVVRTYFNDIGGGAVGDLTRSSKFPNQPDAEEWLTEFADGGYADNYGSTIRGWLLPPASGTYTFWIASDDSSELRLATTADPAAATSIASVSGATGEREWTKNPSQQSLPIVLEAGRAYYIEARHKEGGGGDHVAVAWEGPGISRRVIPGQFIAPRYQNYAPRVAAQMFLVRENARHGATVGRVLVNEVNRDETHTFTLTGGTGSGVFGIDSQTGRVFVADAERLDAAAEPSYTLQLQISDSGTPTLSTNATCTVNVAAAEGITATGIVQQFWNNIGGNDLAALTNDPRFPAFPSARRTLTRIDTGVDYAESYGSRIRAYVVPPADGGYTFHLACDDDTRVLLGTDDSVASARQIIQVNGASGRLEWARFGSQKSAEIALVAGQRYYLEILHKEGVGGDFVQLGWTPPAGSAIELIPSSALRPFDTNQPPVWTGRRSFAPTGGEIIGTVTATDPEGEFPTYAILPGGDGGLFTIDPATGVLRLADGVVLADASDYQVTVAAQDQGIGGLFPLGESSTVVTIFTGSPLVAHLRFDESEGTTAFDSSVRGNHASTFGEPIWTPGLQGNAIRLDGTDDHLKLPNGVLAGLSDVTLAAWVKLDTVDNWSRIFDLGSNTSSFLFLTPRNGSNGRIRFSIQRPGKPNQIIDGKEPLQAGKWTHVAVTLAGTTGTLFVDGVAVGSNSWMTITPADLGISTNNFIGKSQYPDPLLRGLVDEFQIHRRAFSGTEVADLAAPAPAPAIPSNLAAAVEDEGIVLTWSAADGAVRYTVKRSGDSGGPFLPLADDVAETRFTDTSVVAGATYHYVISATNAGGESSDSAAATATLAPAAPGSLAATAGDSRVTLTWDASPGATRYVIRRGTASGGPYTAISEDGSATTFIDEGLTNGTTYHYVVAAANDGGTSADSAEASATPQAPPARAFLRLDETAGTTASDASGSGRHATLAGGATWSAGRINGAVDFDGLDDHAVFAPGLVEGLGDFSVAMWVKWDGGALGRQRIFDFGSSSLRSMSFTPQAGPGGRAGFAIATNGVLNEQRIDAPAALPTGVWTHVAVVLSGTTGTLFIDGAAVATNPAMTLNPSALGATTGNFLGRAQSLGEPSFSGSLDEFQLHPRALAASDIALLADPPDVPAGLIATAGDGEISLAWEAVEGATRYLVGRSNTAGGPYTTIASQLTEPTHLDTPLDQGTTYYYVVSASNGIAESSRSAEVAASPLSPHQLWRRFHFGTAVNSGDAADAADPDGDGVSNLLERAFAGDPKAAEQDLLPRIDPAAPLLGIIYRKANAADDLTVIVEESADLASPWIPAEGGGEVLSDDGIVRDIRFTRPAGNNRILMLRVRVTGP